MHRQQVGVGIWLFSVLAPLLVGAHGDPASLPRCALSATAGILFGVATASALEWLVHRHLYHRSHTSALRPIYLVHHRGHHADHFPTWRYVARGTPRRFNAFRVGEQGPLALGQPLASSAMGSLHLLAYLAIGSTFMVLPAWLCTGDAWFTGAVFAVLSIVSPLFIAVHDAMHFPGLHRWIERQPWFHWLDRHHYIHHVDTEANVNFLLPLGDLLFGTLRTRLSERELHRHGSFEQAIQTPIGSDEPARQAVLRVGRKPGRAPESAPPAAGLGTAPPALEPEAST